jgi:hypothetical protein
VGPRLKPRPGGNYLAIEDRDRRYCRITRGGNLDSHIPVSELREADDPVAYLTGLLVELLTRRAGHAGVEAPPGAVPTAGG